MNYIAIIIILFTTACGSSGKTSSDNSTQPSELSKRTIQIKVNEEKTIQVPGWASNVPEMEFTLSDTSVAKIFRKEIVSTYDSTGLRPGDPVQANWVIRGLKPGTSKVKFTGRRPEQNNSANLRLKNFKIIVTE